MQGALHMDLASGACSSLCSSCLQPAFYCSNPLALLSCRTLPVTAPPLRRAKMSSSVDLPGARGHHEWELVVKDTIKVCTENTRRSCASSMFSFFYCRTMTREWTW